MMKINKFGALLLGSSFLFVGCNGGSISNNTYSLLNYEDARNWIRTNYGAGSQSGTIKHPEFVSSEWFIDGQVNASSTEKKAATGYLKNHFINFLTSYSYNDINTVENTVLNDRLISEYKFGFKTTEVLSSTAPEAFYYSLDELHMNNTLDYFFKGAAKYGVTYKAYKNKTLEVSGNFYYSYEDTKNKGIHVIEMPYCVVTFNSDGSLSQIKFYYNGDAECNYVWISTDSVASSASVYFSLYKNTQISINFTY